MVVPVHAPLLGVADTVSSGWDPAQLAGYDANYRYDLPGGTGPYRQDPWPTVTQGGVTIWCKHGDISQDPVDSEWYLTLRATGIPGSGLSNNSSIGFRRLYLSAPTYRDHGNFWFRSDSAQNYFNYHTDMPIFDGGSHYWVYIVKNISASGFTLKRWFDGVALSDDSNTGQPYSNFLSSNSTGVSWDDDGIGNYQYFGVAFGDNEAQVDDLNAWLATRP